MLVLGAHQGQCDGLCGCGRLLSSLKRHRLHCKRRKCPSLHAPAGSNDTAQHNGHKASAWDSERAHDHFGNDAGEYACVRVCVCFKECVAYASFTQNKMQFAALNCGKDRRRSFLCGSLLLMLNNVIFEFIVFHFHNCIVYINIRQFLIAKW